jgi:DnaJ-class molecular chaperone
MVCIDCNGKGYVIEKERELVCKECHGHGEYSFSDSVSDQNPKIQEVHEVR